MSSRKARTVAYYVAYAAAVAVAVAAPSVELAAWFCALGVGMVGWIDGIVGERER